MCIKDYEVRIYETNKYALIKYRTIDQPGSEKSKPATEEKQGNDEVMTQVWKLMKYTQGENETKTAMTLVMPVFISIETVDESTKEIEVKVMISLPGEYQVLSTSQSAPPEPPKSLIPEIEFEVIEKFKCYVR